LNLPESVINSEFPKLKLNSKDGKNVVLTFDNGKNIVIAKQNDDGSYDSKVYEFNNVEDNVVWPVTPELPNRLARLDLNSWNGVVDSNARDDLNNNSTQVQETVNSIVDYVIDQRNFFTKFKDSLSNLKSFIVKIINLSVAKYMHDNVETQYYKKSEVNNKLDDIEKKIANIRRRLPNDTTIGTFHNPSRSDQMPTNIDVNDKVTPEAQAVLDKIKNEGGN